MNTNEILVTVGIPVFNPNEHFESAIRSVLNQSHTNFELIITDDGSTNGKTEEILSRFSDSRINFINDETNRGISYRLNQQISSAKGKYFFRMDADDIMFPYRIEFQVQFLENNQNIDATGSTAIIIDENNNIVGKRGSAKIIEHSFHSALKSNIFIHPTVAAPLTWFKKHLYKEDLSGVEDYDLWIRASESSTFAILDTPLLFYRDPHRIKVNVNRFRKDKSRRLLIEYKNVYPKHKNKINTSLYRKWVKDHILHILILFKLDHHVVKKRNSHINNLLEYTTILKKSMQTRNTSTYEIK